MTNGGLRTGLPAGPITLGSVFELMPFENELVVLDAPGPVVQQLFEYAARIKMAVSGATYAVTFDGLPKDIRIGGQPFDANQDRTLAHCHLRLPGQRRRQHGVLQNPDAAPHQRAAPQRHCRPHPRPHQGRPARDSQD